MIAARHLVPALALLAAGCAAVGPDYQRPATALPGAYVGGGAAPLGPVASRAWWEAFHDPLLSDLIARGGGGLSVAAAAERIRAAEAVLRQTGLNQALSGSGELDLAHSGGEGYASSTTTASLGAAVVLDLFGGVRRSQQSASASLDAAGADLETARLAWLADLVGRYADARFYQEALALTRIAIDTRKDTLAITRRQFDAGAATEYEVAQAEALLAAGRAELPYYGALFDASVFAIATLMNAPAGPLLARMQAGAPQLRAPTPPETGVPADLLRNRPDLRAAESSLIAATAAIGVAEAQLYPSVTLSGAITATADAAGWSFGPTLTLPAFNRGALSAARDEAVSKARQAEISWRSAVLGAVEDVQVAQSSLARQTQRTKALRAAAQAYGRALDLARRNHREGAISLLDLLDTDRSTASARITAAAAANAAAQAWATLQIALGAGAAAP